MMQAYSIVRTAQTIDFAASNSTLNDTTVIVNSVYIQDMEMTVGSTHHFTSPTKY